MKIFSEKEINQICGHLNNYRNNIHEKAKNNPMLYHSVAELDLLIEKLRGG